jgi:hypothetical protein
LAAAQKVAPHCTRAVTTPVGVAETQGMPDFWAPTIKSAQ